MRTAALLAAAALLVLPRAARGVGLVDEPMASAAGPPQYLDGPGWTVSNGALTVGARVPGDLLTDLQVAGVIGDPLFEDNFAGRAWVG